MKMAMFWDVRPYSLVDTYQIIWHYIAENSNFHRHRYENSECLDALLSLRINLVEDCLDKMWAASTSHLTEIAFTEHSKLEQKS